MICSEVCKEYHKSNGKERQKNNENTALKWEGMIILVSYFISCFRLLYTFFEDNFSDFFFENIFCLGSKITNFD